MTSRTAVSATSALLFLLTVILSTVLMFILFLSDVLALNLEGVHDVKLHHPSSSVATSNQ